jgi:uncharacterized protein YjiS (DUF1127 family)
MIKQLIKSIQRKQMYRQTVRELNSLSDYELNDLGLNRGMIAELAYETTYGKEPSCV